MIRRRSGLSMTLLAGTGLVVALYLAITKLAGGSPVCGPLRGCETVASSEYSVLFGVPVAVFGVAYSVVLLALSIAWWRQGDRRALLGAYGLGLLGCFVVAALTYLEVAVIEAICVYCVVYAITIVTGFVIAAATVRSSGTTS